MHGDLTGQFEVMDAAFQIIARGTQIAQFLRFHHLLLGWGGFHLSLFGGDGCAVQLVQLLFARRDTERQLVIKGQRLVIEDIERFDILHQGMLMAQQLIRDLVDLALYIFIARHEIMQRLGLAEQTLPPAALAVGVQLIHREPADRAHDIAQAIACGADILVLDVLQHGLADLLQFRLRARAKGDDRIGVFHIDLFDALADRCGGFLIGIGQGHQRGRRLRQRDGCHFFDHLRGRFGFFFDFSAHDGVVPNQKYEYYRGSNGPAGH